MLKNIENVPEVLPCVFTLSQREKESILSISIAILVYLKDAF